MAPAAAQKTESDKAAEQQNRQASAEPGDGTALEIRPGPPIIKTKDIVQEKKLTPWLRLPRYIIRDQKGIWTSPFHTSKADAKWWAIFGGATVALVATDRWSSKQLPNTRDQLAVSTWTSRFGAAYSLLPISAGFYFIGLGSGSERFRETGILGFETLANTAIVVTALKFVTQRERPTEGREHGAFWAGSRFDSSFPSGHATHSWALASVVAHEYPRPLIVPITAYALATTVCASRFAVRKHFAGDIILGAGIGWFVGDYVFARRHNRELDHPSAIDRIRSHIHIGGPERAALLPGADAERSAALQRLSEMQ
ncbi:MAG TPA: phosphatase PAP2 family protein [Bryobacteraceae bacterium]|jgi:membrane-associated phospholipid phosphatase|nr:phosphatase PAP2 family protein [Bryobacteraceae bacterium]